MKYERYEIYEKYNRYVVWINIQEKQNRIMENHLFMNAKSKDTKGKCLKNKANKTH